jgi:hypothetical protein
MQRMWLKVSILAAFAAIVVCSFDDASAGHRRRGRRCGGCGGGYSCGGGYGGGNGGYGGCNASYGACNGGYGGCTGSYGYGGGYSGGYSAGYRGIEAPPPAPQLDPNQPGAPILQTQPGFQAQPGAASPSDRSGAAAPDTNVGTDPNTNRPVRSRAGAEVPPGGNNAPPAPAP